MSSLPRDQFGNVSGRAAPRWVRDASIPKMGNAFADTFRKDLSSMGSNPAFMGGLGSMLQQYRSQLAGPQQYQQNQQQPQVMPQEAAPNPFAGNEQYQALMDYQKSMQPQQEQMDRMNELRTAFEGTGGFKDYRIEQMQQQLQQRQQQNPRMGMGLGGMRPTGMNMYGGMPRPQQNMYGGQRGGYGGQQGGYGMQPQRNPYGQQGGYGGQQQYQQPQRQQYQQPQYQPYKSPYQQSQPQPQQFGGYGMGQSSQGGYGGYGGMSNPYQPQQYGQQMGGQAQQFGRMY